MLLIASVARIGIVEKSVGDLRRSDHQYHSRTKRKINALEGDRCGGLFGFHGKTPGR